MIITSTKKMTYELRSSPSDVKILAFNRDGRPLETASNGRAGSTLPSFATKTESSRDTTFTGESSQNIGAWSARLLATIRSATRYCFPPDE